MKCEVALATFQKDIWFVIVSASSGPGDFPKLFSISVFVFGDQSLSPALILTTLRTNTAPLKVQKSLDIYKNLM